MGIKLHLFEDDPKDNFFSISYTPTFDSISFSDPSSAGNTLSRTGIRHYFKAEMNSILSGRLKNQSKIIYAPFLMSTPGSNVTASDETRMKVETTFTYDLDNNFYWDYALEYEQDELRAVVYDIDSTNTKQTFRLRYEFGL